MQLVISLTVLVLFVADKVYGSPIFGGYYTPIHKYPWVVSIQIGGYHNCGGSIISSIAIVTAAHCVSERPELYIVRVGSERTDFGGTWHYVDAIRKHQNYNSSVRSILEAVNDVAIIKVSPPMQIGRYGAQIQLPNNGYLVPAGTNVSIAGWGSTSYGGWSSYELRSVKLHIVDSGECSRAYGDLKGTSVTLNHQICTYGYHSDTCKGDSGGPIVTEGDILVGIVSGGRGCGDYRFPGINQDVAYFRDWIDEQLKNR